MARNYSSVASEKTLSDSITAGSSTIKLNNLTGLPTPPYTLVINPDTASEEIVTVNSVVSGTTLNVSRGEEGTTAQSATSGNTVRHMVTGRDLQDAQDHISNTTTAHGATGAVVGTTNSQVLSSKSISLGTNTITGTTAQFNTALTDNDFATQAGTETLTNKTLTSPKLNDTVALTSTSTELNTIHSSGVTNADLVKLHAVTSTAAELNSLTGSTATSSDLVKLHGVTATAAELNKLSGATASTTELNYVTGVTSAIQTQLNAKAVAGSNHIPYKMAAGTFQVTNPGNGNSATGSVDLTSFSFDSATAPIVVLGISGGSSGANNGAIVKGGLVTYTSIPWTVYSNSATSGSITVSWHAVQMTSTSGAG